MTDTSTGRKNRPMADTPVRNVRIKDELWTAAKQKAYLRRETLTEVIKRALESYVAEEDE